MYTIHLCNPITINTMKFNKLNCKNYKISSTTGFLEFDYEEPICKQHRAHYFIPMSNIAAIEMDQTIEDLDKPIAKEMFK